MSAALTALDPVQKAAAVLVAVGPERAAKVLKYLGQDDVEQLAVEVATLGDVSEPELEAVLTEFRAQALAHQHLIRGGEQQARELLRPLLGAEADDIVDRLLATTAEAPFHFLRLHEPAEIVQHLTGEHPQTIALVLAHLPARLAATLLAGLDPAVQASVAARLAVLDRADPDVLVRIEQTLRDRLGEARRRTGRRDGVKELADLLNQVDRTTERSILGQLEADDPVLAERVRSLMFVFEDLVTVEDRALQEVLRKVELGTLAIALKGVSGDLQAKLERNLSERARATLAEEQELLGAVRLSDVEDAQTAVVRVVHALERDGVVQLSRGQEEFVA